MSFDTRHKNLHLLLYVFAVLGIASAIYGGMSSVFTSSGVTTTALAQTNPFLEQRINRIEQNLNYIETRLNRLEQNSSLPSITPKIADNNGIETRALRSEIEILQLRVGELECGMLRLDERTLTDTARRSRGQKALSATDPCRKDASAPLKLSARP
jgi:predicted  nucleic acid-binding Zn-ribbon protein